MFGTRHSKINRLQKTIEYQKNEQSKYKIFELKYGNTKLLGNTKYNPGKVSTSIFCFCFLVPS